MADIIVQPKVKNADGSFDLIVIGKTLQCIYASEDTSKGTIEERLTNLGV